MRFTSDKVSFSLLAVVCKQVLLVGTCYILQFCYPKLFGLQQDVQVELFLVIHFSISSLIASDKAQFLGEKKSVLFFSSQQDLDALQLISAGFSVNKNAVEAAKCREKGNSSFKSRDYKSAALHYSQVNLHTLHTIHVD